MEAGAPPTSPITQRAQGRIQGEGSWGPPPPPFFFLRGDPKLPQMHHKLVLTYVYGLHIQIYIGQCIYTYMHACIHMGLRTHIHTYMHTYIHVYIHTQTDTHRHTHTQTHTHTHTYTYAHTQTSRVCVGMHHHLILNSYPDPLSSLSKMLYLPLQPHHLAPPPSPSAWPHHPP